MPDFDGDRLLVPRNRKCIGPRGRVPEFPQLANWQRFNIPELSGNSKAACRDPFPVAAELCRTTVAQHLNNIVFPTRAGDKSGLEFAA